MPSPRHVLPALLAVSLTVSCGASSPGAPPTETPDRRVAPAAVTPPGAASAEASAPPSTPSASGSAVPVTAPSVAPAIFPPPDFAPPSQKSASAGDGHWTPFGDAAKEERAAGVGTEPPLIVRTVVHPHPSSRYVTVTLAAVDLSRLALRLVPGTEDLVWAKQDVTPASGLVPSSDQPSLVFVMNGGFQPKHGHWGLVANGVVISEPRDDGCTLALYKDGAVSIAPWTRLAESRPQIDSLRQTPACLVDAGAVHPLLLKGQDKAWAGHAADVKTQRRSAVGIDATGRILFYAMGEEAEPRSLAEALRVAGAVTAAELDINWYWTRFLLFGMDQGALRITSTLVDKTEHQPKGYVLRPSTRDFFYAVKRAVAAP